MPIPASEPCEFRAWAWHPTDGILGELPLCGGSVECFLSGQASARLEFSTNHPIWKKLAALDTWCVGVVVECICGDDSTIVYAGWMPRIRTSSGATRLRISPVDLASHFWAQPVTDKLTFTNQPTPAIVDALIAYAQQGTGDLGFTVSHTGTPTTVRTITFPPDECRSVGDILEELAEHPTGGFEWCLDYRWSASAPRRPVFELTTHQNKAIAEPLLALNQPNVCAWAYDRDGSGRANSVCLIGPRGADITHLDQVEKDDGCPRRSFTFSRTDIADETLLPLLAEAELERRCSDIERWDLALAVTDASGCPVWTPKQVTLGQRGRLTIDDAANNVVCAEGVKVRVVAKAFSFDEHGLTGLSVTAIPEDDVGKYRAVLSTETEIARLEKRVDDLETRRQYDKAVLICETTIGPDPIEGVSQLWINTDGCLVITKPNGAQVVVT